jgi:sulfonate transport system substrate-binding protein
LSTGIAAQNSFFLANRIFVEKYPNIINVVNAELASATAWAKSNKPEAATLFSQATGVDIEAQRRTVERTEFVFSPVSDAVVDEQQAGADRFFKLGLIPNPISVRDIVWTWVPNS